SYSKTLPGLEIDGEKVITSEHALELTELPNKAIVIGGGGIGGEFASARKSPGVEVEIIEGLPRLIAAEDADSSKQLERAFRKRGIKFHTGKFFEKVEKTASGVQVTIQGGTVVEGDVVLVAVGRGPVTDGIGYQEQGVNMDRGFVLVDENLRTNLP
ncbi:dihydrolipoamide dehydrogenase, partial [Thermoactinomyces vulgaris]